MGIRIDRLVRLGITSAFTVTGLLLGLECDSASAQNQIEPDETLGGEGSLINRETIRGIESDRISGGARRGQNLFHSFEQFDVGEGLGAYFENPEAVQNIFSRVTGSDASEILGRLGVIRAGSSDVLGDANLFFINPNGILFGPNSSLDIGGSFAATTADGIQFGENGFFSATNPETPSQLLTIDPSAFFFNQLLPGSITNNSIAADGTRPDGTPALGLRVSDGESLLLIGGDVDMRSGGSLNAQGGRIELGGLAAAGTIGLDITDNVFSLTFPDGVARSNLFLGNDARVSVRGFGGGDIAVNADQFTATNGGRLVAGTEDAGNGGNITVNATQVDLIGVNSTSGFSSGLYNAKIGSAALSNAGNITVNAETLNLSSGAFINASTSGLGNAGNVTFQISGDMFLSGPVPNYIQSNIEAGGVGEGGDITINAGSLFLRDGSQIQAGVRRASDNIPAGEGNAGNIVISIQDTTMIDGVSSNGFPSGIIAFLDFEGTGSGGNIQLETGSLSLTNGARLSVSTFGTGDAGRITIDADNEVVLSGVSENGFSSGIFSGVENGGIGNSGNIDIRAGSLSLNDGALISSALRGASFGFSGGRGNTGDITIRVDEDVTISGNERVVNGFSYISFIDSSLGSGAVGQAGSINLEAGSLLLLNLMVVRWLLQFLALVTQGTFKFKLIQFGSKASVVEDDRALSPARLNLVRWVTEV